MRNQPEHGMQKAFFDYVDLRYPQYRPYNIFSIDHAGWRKVQHGKDMKDRGCISGVPDVFVMVKSGDYSGMWIELKANKNKPTTQQMEFLGEAKLQGFKCATCWSVEKAISELNGYLTKFVD